MGSDRSLDDFLSEEPDDHGSSDENEPGDAAETEVEPIDSDTTQDSDANADSSTPDTDATVTVDPAVSTATWTTDGAACDRCGDVVERRWLDSGIRVCVECKDW